MREYTIAAVPGDGIGGEVIEAGTRVLHAVATRDGAFTFRIEKFTWGTDYYMEHGRMMPEEALETLKPFDAIYFGSAGAYPRESDACADAHALVRAGGHDRVACGDWGARSRGPSVRLIRPRSLPVIAENTPCSGEKTPCYDQ